MPSTQESLEEAPIAIHVKGPSNMKLDISIKLSDSVADLKGKIAEKSEPSVPAANQRLIYSGRVLKDGDTLSSYNIKDGHAIHMVKGAARTEPSASSSTSAPPRLPNMTTGQIPSDPLTQLNGPMGHGLMTNAFNPFADMGLNPNDPNMMQGMLDNPMLLQQMSNLMSNPAVVDQIIASNPQLQAMGPQVRQLMQSENFRQMMSNPQMLQSMMRMSAAMRGGDMFGGGGGEAFPAPGMPSTAQAQNAGSTNSPTPSSPLGGAQQPNFANLATLLGGMGVPGPGMFGSMSAAGGAGAHAQTGTNPASPGATPSPNPNSFGMVDPNLIQSLMGGMGGFGGFGPMGGAGGFGGFGAAAQPADTRSPEERFEVQLRQLNDMGFVNAAQNVRALQATAGNVNAAIEYILGGGGL